MPKNAMPCSCNRSLAAVCGLFASMAAALFFAEDKCLDAGGRISDTAWICETASGLAPSIWSLVSLRELAIVVLAVGVPVYFIVNAISTRLMAAADKRGG